MNDQMQTRSVVTPTVLNGLMQTIAETAAQSARVAGRAGPHIIDLVGSGSMAAGFASNFEGLRIESLISEGKKDQAASFTEGMVVGDSSNSTAALIAVSDPVECTNQLAQRQEDRKRASLSVAVLAAKGAIPLIDSNGYAMKIVIPSGIPVGTTGITIDTPIPRIVKTICELKSCQPKDIEVAILDRVYNEAFIVGFRKENVTVKLYPSGDFEEALLAAMSGYAPRGICRIAYGIGGRTEGFLPVPFIRMMSGSMLFQPVSRITTRQVRRDLPVLTHSEMITTDDCVMAVAAITSAPMSSLHELDLTAVERDEQVYIVRVMLASPMWKECRYETVRITLVADQISERKDHGRIEFVSR